MNWTAVVPLKSGGERKSRLAGRLSYEERAALSDRMATHVLSVVAAAPSVTRVLGLSATPPLAGADWARDNGRGLNAELEAMMEASDLGRLLILHGDLPLVDVDDVEALVAAAGLDGVALAPDRHGTGTNAIAMANGPIRLAFGENSFTRHKDSIMPRPAVVRRPGLALDIDTPDDLRAATEAGFVFAF